MIQRWGTPDFVCLSQQQLSTQSVESLTVTATHRLLSVVSSEAAISRLYKDLRSRSSFSSTMLTQSHLLSRPPFPSSVGTPALPKPSNLPLLPAALIPPPPTAHRSLRLPSPMASNPKLSNNVGDPVQCVNGKQHEEEEEEELDRFAEAANRVADAAGEVIRKYFRKKFEILDKADLSPVTIADQAAEEAMISIISENFPSHAIFGEENGWRCKEKSADYVWVLDPIDGTKSFITGKPLFGTLIALLYKGKPILGIIDQPVLKERWIGIKGRKTTLNGLEIATRTCSKLSQAYLYTTSPHLFKGEAEQAFFRVRDKVKVPLYGCDCYAYALLASGFVDLVIESGLKPYDFLSLIPVIEGAGGVITDWKGQPLGWEASSDSHVTSFNVAAAGDESIHKQALDALEWQ